MRAFTVRIPDALDDRIRAQAKACRRNRNQQLIYILERAVPVEDIVTGPVKTSATEPDNG